MKKGTIYILLTLPGLAFAIYYYLKMRPTEAAKAVTKKFGNTKEIKAAVQSKASPIVADEIAGPSIMPTMQQPKNTVTESEVEGTKFLEYLETTLTPDGFEVFMENLKKTRGDESFEKFTEKVKDIVNSDSFKFPEVITVYMSVLMGLEGEGLLLSKLSFKEILKDSKYMFKA